MNKHITIIISLSFLGFVCLAFLPNRSKISSYNPIVTDSMGVSDLLTFLGDSENRNPVSKIDTALVRVGKQLIIDGKADYKNYKGKLISTHFKCTDCHNLKQEYSNLKEVGSTDRLNYAVKNNLPFLPASTFYGIYNRNSFYTKDYYKKYGDLINNAKDTLENAIQVCAKYCSSGRFLTAWEEDAIMHYFKANELKIKDLNLPKNVLKDLKLASKLPVERKNELISALKENYTLAYTATFLETKPRNQRTYGETGNVNVGEKIYDKSCMHCHANGRVTDLVLDKDVLSARLLWKHRKDYTDESPYQIIRHGTYPKTGRQQYMPLYPEEKMSKQQVEDLMAYIKQLAKK